MAMADREFGFETLCLLGLVASAMTAMDRAKVDEAAVK
jgi:hypothetical protein